MDLLWIIPCVVAGLFTLFILYRAVYNLWRQWQRDSDERARYQAETKQIQERNRFAQWKADNAGFLGVALDRETGDMVNLDTLRQIQPEFDSQLQATNEKQRLLAALTGTSLRQVQEILSPDVQPLPVDFAPMIEPVIDSGNETIDL